jgi:predicted nucleic acid-binding protein
MSLIFPAGARLFFDTAPIIYYIEKHPDFGDGMDDLIRQAYVSRHVWVTSFVSWIEALTLPRRERNSDLEKIYKAWLEQTPFLSVIQSNPLVMRQAVHFRAEYGLKTPDAIQLATAQVCRADAVITNDQDWKRVREMNVITLDEL